MKILCKFTLLETFLKILIRVDELGHAWGGKVSDKQASKLLDE